MSDKELKALVASLAIAQKHTDEQIAQTFKGIAELRESQAKTDAQLAKTSEELRISLARTDAQLAKTSEELRISLARTDAQLAKTSEELRNSLARTDAQLAKTDAQLSKTDARLDKVAKMLGSIGNNQGDVAEEFFYNSLANKKELAGVHYDFVGQNWQHHINGVKDEFDIVMVNGKDIAIIEVKYKAHEADLEKLLTKKYQNFKALYPTYKDFNHHLALATFHINEDLKEKALLSGVMVLQRKGDVIETFA